MHPRPSSAPGNHGSFRAACCTMWLVREIGHVRTCIQIYYTLVRSLHSSDTDGTLTHRLLKVTFSVLHPFWQERRARPQRHVHAGRIRRSTLARWQSPHGSSRHAGSERNQTSITKLAAQPCLSKQGSVMMVEWTCGGIASGKSTRPCEVTTGEPDSKGGGAKR